MARFRVRGGGGTKSFLLGNEPNSEVEIGVETDKGSASVCVRFRNDVPEIVLNGAVLRLVIDEVALTVLRALLIQSSAIRLETGEAKITCERDLIATMSMCQIAARMMRLSSDDMLLKSTGVMGIESGAALSVKAAIADIDAGAINLLGQVSLGKDNLRNIARVGDQVQVVGVQVGGGTATGTITSGGVNLSG